MSDEHYLRMAVMDLSYALDELSRARMYLNEFVSVDNIAFKVDEIDDLKKNIDKQIANINNYIIPAVHEENLI